MSTALVAGNLAGKLSSIAQAGFDGIELAAPDFAAHDGTAEDLARMADDLGLRIFLLATSHGPEGLAGPLRIQAFDHLERSFDLLQALNTDLLLVESSAHPRASGDPDLIASDLADLAERAKKRDVRVAYHAVPCAQHIRSDAAALEQVERVGSPHLGLGLNSFFALRDGSRPARLRNLAGARVFHVQLSDGVPTDLDADIKNQHVSMLPGQGSLNLSGFVRILAKNGYAGNWSLAPAGDVGERAGSNGLEVDGYRALVNLLDVVQRTEPDTDFGIPALPERVYASGFEFIEFAADQAHGETLKKMLKSMCFRMERRHISKSVELWRQGAVNIVVNTDRAGFAHSAFVEHGPSVCDMGLRVKDATQTVQRAAALGAPVFSQPVSTGELDIPAILGVGGNVVHFIDEKSELHRVWDIEFDPVAKTEATPPAGLRRIDHVAETMKYEEMQSWLLYYTSTFEMAKTPLVDVADPSGVIRSQAIASPEGEVRLNLNGAASRRTFAGAFLAEKVGAGVQHIAFVTDDIFETSAHLANAGFERLKIAAKYYDDLQATFELDDEFTDRLRAGNILYERDGRGEYLQIYSVPIFEGFFFEIVERRQGYDGYGARNASHRLAAQVKISASMDMART